ncbi:C40 family peptidase [Streptomyces pactum]|uniref:C40 family peptidase n=1 Tax=Streptomyces pactum TaxID=68249 RepID=UPI0036F90C5C
MVVAALICAVTVPGLTGPAYAAPDDPEPAAGAADLEAVHRKVESLYRQAEAATDAYNLARGAQGAQERAVVRISQAVLRASVEMDALTVQAGALARAQYRDGRVLPEARLLLSDDPQDFLDGVSLARKGRHATGGVIGRLARTRERLDRYAESASREWSRLDAERVKKETARKEINRKLNEAKKLESKLKKEERERLRRLEEEKARKAQEKWLRTGILDRIGESAANAGGGGTAGPGGDAAVGGAGGEATPAGERAVEFARAQIGKDYVWGAEGPESYDCSGLTLKAWAAAGLVIPRTSQEQWRRLPRVEVTDLRPGDLIVYYRDATHVGMYVGDGVMVHAPRPGRQVTLAGAGSMPILGVVRPGG